MRSRKEGFWKLGCTDGSTEVVRPVATVGQAACLSFAADLTTAARY
jgi:hypothetical protein